MLVEKEDAIDAVAARIRFIREVLGMTTSKEMADKLDISPQAWGSYENAKRELTLSAAKKLRKSYLVPLDFIYFGNSQDLPTRFSKEL